MRDEKREAGEVLTDREVKALRLRYSVDYPATLARVGAALGGVTKERARKYGRECALVPRQGEAK